MGNDQAYTYRERANDKLQEYWRRFVLFMNGKKLYTGMLLVVLPKLAAMLAVTLTSMGADPLDVARYTFWGGGSALMLLGAAHKVIKKLDDMTPDECEERDPTDMLPAMLLVLLLLPGLTGCGYGMALQQGNRLHPDQGVVNNWYCMGQAQAGDEYLNSSSFSWLGPALARYRVEAQMRVYRGQCPCPSSGRCADVVPQAVATPAPVN